MYDGVITELREDTDMDEIICMRIRSEKNRYTDLIYGEALYSQLSEAHLGLSVIAREITLDELKSPEHAPVWEQYKRERRDPEGSALGETDRHGARRLFLHMLGDNTEGLIVAKELKIVSEQKPGDRSP